MPKDQSVYVHREDELGNRTVTLSMPVRVYFTYLHNLRVREGLRNCDLGPHLLLNLEAKQPLFSFRPMQIRERMVTLPIQLTRRLREKHITRWREKKVQGHFVEFRGPDGKRVQAVVYSEALVFKTDDSRAEMRPSAIGREVDRHTRSGTIVSCWSPDTQRDRTEHRNFPMLFYRAQRWQRFPDAPQDLLTFERACTLNPGDELGVPLPDDYPLELGFDVELEKLGFPANENGHNAVTDYRRFSFPLTPPPAELWRRKPLPAPLAEIEAMQDTPRHSWRTVVLDLCGQRLTRLERGVAGNGEPLEPTAVQRPREERQHDQPQPCYHGPRSCVERIGRYLIFTIERPAGTVYLVDSNWLDKEVAMHLFDDVEKAREYCRGVRDESAIGRKVHRAGWEQEVEGWIDRSLNRRLAPLPG